MIPVHIFSEHGGGLLYFTSDVRRTSFTQSSDIRGKVNVITRFGSVWLDEFDFELYFSQDSRNVDPLCLVCRDKAKSGKNV